MTQERYTYESEEYDAEPQSNTSLDMRHSWAVSDLPGPLTIGASPCLSSSDECSPNMRHMRDRYSTGQPVSFAMTNVLRPSTGGTFQIATSRECTTSADSDTGLASIEDPSMYHRQRRRSVSMDASAREKAQLSIHAIKAKSKTLDTKRHGKGMSFFGKKHEIGKASPIFYRKKNKVDLKRTSAPLPQTLWQTRDSSSPLPFQRQFFNEEEGEWEVPELVALAMYFSASPKEMKRIRRFSGFGKQSKSPKGERDIHQEDAATRSQSRCVFIVSGDDEFKTGIEFEVHRVDNYETGLREAQEWARHSNHDDLPNLQSGLEVVEGLMNRCSLDSTGEDVLNVENPDTSDMPLDNSTLSQSFDLNSSVNGKRTLFPKNKRRGSAPSAVVLKNRSRSLSLKNLIPDSSLDKDDFLEPFLKDTGTTEPRQLLIEGPVEISKGNIQCPQRYLFLCSDILLIAKPKYPALTFKLKLKLPLSELWIGDSVGGQNTSFVMGWPPAENWTYTFPTVLEKEKWFGLVEKLIHKNQCVYSERTLTAKVVNQISSAQALWKCVSIAVDTDVTKLTNQMLPAFNLQDKAADVQMWLCLDENSNQPLMKLQGFENPYLIILNAAKQRRGSAGSVTTSGEFTTSMEDQMSQMKVNFVLKLKRSATDGDDNHISAKSMKAGALKKGGKKVARLFSPRTKDTTDGAYYPNSPDVQRVFGVPLVKVWPDETLPDSVASLFAKVYKHRTLQGLFRTSPSQNDLNALISRVDRSDSAIPEDEFNPKAAASCIKRLLRVVPEGVIMRDLSAEWLAINELPSGHEQIEGLHSLIGRLPPLHQQLLVMLLLVLEAIEADQKFNQMTARNLSIVIAPNLGFPDEITGSPAGTPSSGVAKDISLGASTIAGGCHNVVETMILNACELISREVKDQVLARFQRLIPEDREDGDSGTGASQTNLLEPGERSRSVDDITFRLNNASSLEEESEQHPMAKSWTAALSKDSGLNVKSPHDELESSGTYHTGTEAANSPTDSMDQLDDDDTRTTLLQMSTPPMPPPRVRRRSLTATNPSPPPVAPTRSRNLTKSRSEEDPSSVEQKLTSPPEYDDAVQRQQRLQMGLPPSSDSEPGEFHEPILRIGYSSPSSVILPRQPYLPPMSVNSRQSPSVARATFVPRKSDRLDSDSSDVDDNNTSAPVPIPIERLGRRISRHRTPVPRQKRRPASVHVVRDSPSPGTSYQQRHDSDVSENDDATSPHIPQIRSAPVKTRTKLLVSTTTLPSHTTIPKTHNNGTLSRPTSLRFKEMDPNTCQRPTSSSMRTVEFTTSSDSSESSSRKKSRQLVRSHAVDDDDDDDDDDDSLAQSVDTAIETRSVYPLCVSPKGKSVFFSVDRNGSVSSSQTGRTQDGDHARIAKKKSIVGEKIELWKNYTQSSKEKRLSHDFPVDAESKVARIRETFESTNLSSDQSGTGDSSYIQTTLPRTSRAVVRMSSAASGVPNNCITSTPTRRTSQTRRLPTPAEHFARHPSPRRRSHLPKELREKLEKEIESFV